MRTFVTIVAIAVSLVGIARPGEALPRFTFVQQTEQGEYSLLGDLALSPDGRFAYVSATYAAEILVFERSAETGALTERLEVDTPPDVIALVISPDGVHLYAVTYGDGRVLSFLRDQASGNLALVQSQQVVVGGVQHLQRAQGIAMSADGADVYITGDDDDALVQLRRDAVTGFLTVADVHVNGANGVTGLDGPLGVAVTADGTGVYVAAALSRAIVAFRRDPVTGALTFVESQTETSNYFSPFNVTTSGDSAHVYLAANNGIVVYRRDPMSSALTKVHATDDFAGNAIALTADGGRAYACGAHVGMIGYTRDPQSGALVADEHIRAGDEGAPAPGYCQILKGTADGQQLYLVESQEIAEQVYSYDIAVFRRPQVECSATPQAACRGTVKPRASSLLIVNKADGAKDKLKWKWKGAATSFAELGDPVAHANDYALCLYDASGVLVSTRAPGVSPCDGLGCWILKSAAEYRYVDRAGRRDGLVEMALRAGENGLAKIRVLVRGPRLGLPTAAIAGTAIVQVQASDGQTSRCWEARYSAPTVDRPDRYSAHSN